MLLQHPHQIRTADKIVDSWRATYADGGHVLGSIPLPNYVLGTVVIWPGLLCLRYSD
jgi:hypothetical protein